MEIVLPAWLSVWCQAYYAGDQTSPNLGFFFGIFTGIFQVQKYSTATLRLIGTRAWLCAGVTVGHLTSTPILRFLESK